MMVRRIQLIAAFSLAIVSLFALRLGLSQSEQVESSGPKWSVGYWTGLNDVPVSSIDWGGLTHVVHVAAIPDLDGSLTFTCSHGLCEEQQFTAEADTLIDAAHTHHVKVLLGLTGGPADKGVTWTGATSAANLTRFVANINAVVTEFNYDGVDLDWETTLKPATYPQMSGLLEGLRHSLRDRLISADVGGDDIAYWGRTHTQLDRLNAMTYEMVGNWNPYSWFNSALYGDPCDCVWSWDLMRRRMRAGGVPPGKLNFGIPFYGWISKGGGVTGPRRSNRAQPDLTQANYNVLWRKYDLTHPHWDSVAQVPWMEVSQGWVTFDNSQSIAAKIAYAKKENLGGWFIWALDQDYLPEQEPQHPLLQAVKDEMKKGRDLKPSGNAGLRR